MSDTNRTTSARRPRTARWLALICAAAVLPAAPALAAPAKPQPTKAIAAPKPGLSLRQLNYTEIMFNARGQAVGSVQNKRGLIAMPAFGSSAFDRQSAAWLNPVRGGARDTFLVGRGGVVGKRLLDSSGQVAGAFLITSGATELLFDLDRDGIVELSVLNRLDGLSRVSMTGEAGRRAFNTLLNGQNPFCTGGARRSSMTERANGDASGCPAGRTAGSVTGSGTSSGPGGTRPRDPMDIWCAGFDPTRGRFSGGTRGLDPDNPLPATQWLLDLAANGFDGQRDQLAAAGRFVVMSPLIGLAAVLEFGAHEIAGGGQLGLIAEATERQREAAERRREEAEASGEAEAPPAETPPATGGSTSRPGPEGEALGGPLSVACANRTAPKQSDRMRSAFANALNSCPNPVEQSPESGRATASCMNVALGRSRDAHSMLILAETPGVRGVGGCSPADGPRCETDRTQQLREMRGRAGAYLGSRAICDPRTCQPPLD